MSDRPDAYKVLQVDSEADGDVIQAAYRRLAQKFHPDRAGGTETPEGREAARRMVAINAAWEVLGDERRRAEYDRERAAGRAGWSSAARAEAPEPSQPRPPSGGASGHPTADAGRDARPFGDPVPRTPEEERLTFGRYAGWRLDEIARTDPGYLEWLDRSSAGRPYRDAIDALLRRTGRRLRRTPATEGLPRRP